MSHTKAIWRALTHDPGSKRRAKGPRPLAAWVLTVSVTGTVVIDDVKATVEGLKLQALSEGRCEHKLGVSAVEPAKPFCAVNVSIVEPDWPGLVITMVVGFAAIANPAPKITEIACEVDP